MSRLDILHITSAHPVWDTRIFVKEARSLARHGFRVGVLGPGDADGAELRDGVEIITLARPIGRLRRMTMFGARLYQMTVRLKPKAVHIHDPELLIIARRLKRHGIRVVYDVHEEFPKALLSRAWLGPRWLRAIVARVTDMAERRASRWVDGFVLADAQLSRRFPARSVVVRNYLDVSEWSTVCDVDCARDGQIRCVYVGDITAARGAFRMIDAVQAASDQRMAVHLDLVGPISPDLRAAVAARDCAKAVTFHGRMERADVARMLARADVAFCLLEPTPAYVKALPVKILEYAVNDLPVVATDLPRLRAEDRLGDGLHLVAWDAPGAALADAIRSAHATDRQTRRALRDTVVAHFNWDVEAEKLCDMYARIL